MTDLAPHSPLGGSSAYRWLPEPWGGGCEASPTLAQGADDPESEFAALGTAAHAVAADCLENNRDAWEYIGKPALKPAQAEIEFSAFGFITLVDKDMADAVQVYLDAIRSEYPERNQGNAWVERRFHVPKVHELFYGQLDFAHWQEDTARLHIWDYKHGAGIVVDVEQNPQLMYYGVGALTDLALWDKVKEVVLWIAHPRGWHWAGPIRSWTITPRELFAWQHDVLIPAMNRVAAGSTKTRSGEHCRFCPARFKACPQLLADADELEELIMEMNKAGGAPHLTNEQVGRLLTLGESLKIAAKAARETGFVRAEKGATIPGWKLARARTNREWKDGADKKARREFGNQAFTEPALKSPAGIDALPKGSAFTTKHAFKPDGGLQLVPEHDPRQKSGPGVKSMFKPAGKKPRQKKA